MVVLTELLPGSSSSSSPTHDLDHHPNHRYDVFLSFRGADTRNGFTDHLYNALRDAGIITFLDDEEIDTGEPLKPELETAIQSSRASIIVLSKNYASSTWCLDELVLILDQKRIRKQIVIPLFYDVEPTDVRKQLNSFGEAMAEHKKKMKAETDTEKKNQLAQNLESWKRALIEVANLKGRAVKDKEETEFIEDVIADIQCRLHVPLSNTLPRLIGMDSIIKFISSWLVDESCHTADILTVVGMGGIGKTSLIKYVFQLNSSKFHKSSFIEGINTKANEQSNGLLDLQKQLCGDISKRRPLQAHDVSVYTSIIKNALAHKKVLLVLDDVGCHEQLDALLGNKAFHQGSKIIITTKDASVTERCALFDLPVQPNHKKISLHGLSKTDSLQLLCIHAFKSRKPEEDYKEVSENLVKYCDGHPLGLEVLGRSLQKREVAYWEECIKVLKKEPHSRINKSLKISFDSLLFENDKELFKHIACFFVGEDKDVTETILNSCDLNARYGITNLIDRCLLRIEWRNKLVMHQLLQEMGRDIVRQESPDKPWERSRLWCHEESFKVLEQKKGTGNVLGLALDMRMLQNEKLSESFKMETHALSKMDSLKLLQLNYVKINGSYKNVSKELRWLCMQGFHLKSTPSDLPMENLVALDMSHSSIESFDMSYSSSQPFMSKLKGLIGLSSKDERLLGSLKILNLSFCEQLLNVGGFFLLPALERLILRNCTSLIEVCESVDQCDELVHIDLSYCYNLRKLPKSMGKLKFVKTILLDGCNFHESQIEMGNAKAIPSDLKLFMFPLLRSLSLAYNNLSDECFPMDLSCLAMLEELYLDGNPVVSMPNCVRTLPRLKILHMGNCDKVITIENPPRSLTELVFFSDLKCSLRKIKFDREMSPLNLFLFNPLHFPFEIDGIVKTQDMASVEDKVLHSLGWTNLDFIKERRYKLHHWAGSVITYQTQVTYEFGIFNTFYKEKEMPEWIRCRNKGSSLSFTIPSSPKNVRGLNFCCVQMGISNQFWFPVIKISNITNNQSWIYKHYIGGMMKLCENEGYFKEGEEEFHLSWLSHWMFGPNEMKAGDHITINVSDPVSLSKNIMECGIGFVYDEDGKNEKEEEDVLGYYKSWNHIIGGDLSGFQLTTGEYILDSLQFSRSRFEFILYPSIMECGIGFVYDEDGKNEKKEDVLGYYKSWNHIIGGDLSGFQLPTGEYILDYTQFLRRRVSYYPFIDDEHQFKEKRVSFRAFSPRERSLKWLVG